MHARIIAVLVLAGTAVAAQVPQPFPKPGQPAPTADPAAPVSALPAEPQPTDSSLGVAIYPTAQFITSYDAGKGQRYYLFGTTATFTEIVQYYRSTLKQRGELVFEEPQIHQFEIGRFREETMAFPPSVTVKYYTWGGGAGYLNPKPGAKPARFPTIIQIVPNPGVVLR
jgi:hypothetical protein